MIPQRPGRRHPRLLPAVVALHRPLVVVSGGAGVRMSEPVGLVAASCPDYTVALAKPSPAPRSPDSRCTITAHCTQLTRRRLRWRRLAVACQSVTSRRQASSAWRASCLSSIATVALARKLVVLAWHLLTKREDYAFKRPAAMAEKVRTLELVAVAPARRGHRANPRVRVTPQQRECSGRA